MPRYMKRISGTSPRRRGHDAAAAISGHPAAAAALRGVVVHPKVVSELVGQSHRRPQRVLRVILRLVQRDKPEREDMSVTVQSKVIVTDIFAFASFTSRFSTVV